ncbi:MAG: DUF4412 domain-containing protein [Sphingobacteriaceae bacterium]
MKRILTLATLLLAITQVSAQQKITEGIVVYSLSWNVPEQAQAMAASLPTEVQVYFKGDSTSMKIESQYFSTQSILNTKKEYERLLLDIPIMNKKYSVLFTPADQEMLADKYPQMSLKASSESKVVNGYKASKFEVSESKTNTTFDVWFTKDVEVVANPLSRFYEASYGFPVEFTSFQNGMSVKASVKEIQKTAVPSGVFTASKDYEEMTLTQLMQLRGGQ